MNLLSMLWEFLLTGLFAVGGGLATFPFLMKMTEKYDWFNRQELIDMIAVSESTPGAIGINMATYAGLKAEGYLGGILATFALVLPSILIIWLLIPVLNKYKASQTVKGIFYALRAVSAGLIAASVYQIALESLFDLDRYALTARLTDLFRALPLLLFFIFLFLSFKYRKIHPIFIILLGGILGVFLKL